MSGLCYGEQPEAFPPLNLEQVFSDMRRRGWCPARVIDKKSTQSPSLIYMLSSLASFDHRKHEECTDIKCLETPLALTKSNVGHDTKTCDGVCYMVCVNESEVVRILIDGDYPLIKISTNIVGKFCLTALPAGKSSEYIAISHV